MMRRMEERIEGPRTFKAAVYNRLAAMIRELELPPGARLIEADLAQRLGVSKTPIREALILLHRDGLVELVPHSGATVTWPSVMEYEDVQLVLDAVEQPSLSVVASQMTASQAQGLGRLLEKCRRARAEAQSQRYFETMLQMHKQMFAVARSSWLTQIVEATLLQARRYQRIFIHQFDDTWDIEQAILSDRLHFVQSGDWQAAADAVASGHRRHLELFRERADDPRVAQYLRPRPEPANIERPAVTDPAPGARIRNAAPVGG